MGLYDGVAYAGETGHGTSAETAAKMGWGVVLVVDVSGQAQSAAATALGFRAYRPDLNFAGVILNRVASPRHERLTRLGMEAHGIKVLGSLPRRGDLALPERHLGLIQAVEHSRSGSRDFGVRDLPARERRSGGDQGGRHQHPPRQWQGICPPPLRSASLWRRTRRFPLPIRIFWQAGARLVPRFCHSPPWVMKPLRRTLIWCGCRAAIPNCTQANWPRPRHSAKRCRPTHKPAPCTVNAAATWRWVRP